MRRLTHRLCTPGYARIIRGLIDSPATIEQLCQRHDVGRPSMDRIVRGMHALRLVHVGAFEPEPIKHMPVRVFAVGDAPDAPHPATVLGRQSRHISATASPRQPNAELISFASLMRALTEKRSFEELGEITGICYGALRKNVRHMRSIGLVHIAGWCPRSGKGTGHMPLYRIGVDKADVKKPPPRPKSARNVRYNAARRAKTAQMRLIRALAANASIFNQAA